MFAKCQGTHFYRQRNRQLSKVIYSIVSMLSADYVIREFNAGELIEYTI